MSSENGNGTAGELDELKQRVAAMEARMDRELTALAKAIATAIKFHEKVSERLDEVQRVVLEVGKSGTFTSGGAVRPGNPGVESLANDDELDAKILALRTRLQAPG